VPAPRVVLDTQVCLDLWLFDDPHAAALRDALAAGTLQGMRDAGSRAEWRRVLRYPALALDAARCAALERVYDERLAPFAPDDPAARPEPPLPRCADPDDQPFLELAWASGARALLTRDAALLRLARRVARQGRFAILTPTAFAATGIASLPADDAGRD
jgi:predicted nucleic acid-binding protein